MLRVYEREKTTKSPSLRFFLEDILPGHKREYDMSLDGTDATVGPSPFKIELGAREVCILSQHYLQCIRSILTKCRHLSVIEVKK